jgi:hypothetical protein
VSIFASIAALIAPSPAQAGVYYVGNCGADGINRAWVPTVSTSTMRTELNCRRLGRGFVAETGSPGGPGYASVPDWGYALWSAESPPGTYIDEAHFTATVSTNIRWPAGLVDLQRSSWIWCGPGCHVGTPTRIDLLGLATTKVGFLAQCIPGCSTSWINGFASISARDVVLRIQDLVDPVITSATGSLVAGGWLRGTKTVTVTADDNAGIAALSVDLDGTQHRLQGQPCDFHAMRPCGAATGALDVALEQASDGSHSLTLRAVDPSGRAAAMTRTIRVDNHPPGPVEVLASDDPGWSTRNSFTVRWRNPAYGNASPVAAAVWRLCRFDAPTICRPTQQTAGQNIARLLAVAVPSPGRWALQVWLRDAAGNLDPRTAREIIVRWDPDPPEVEFEPMDPSAPTSVRFRTTDAASAVRSVELTLQRGNDPMTYRLPLALNAGVYKATVDDETLPEGKYTVRARVVDLAGNERTVQGPLLELPARIGTLLTVGSRTRKARSVGAGKRRYVLRRSVRTNFGRTTTLRGRLATPGRNPLADRDITITERVDLPAATWHVVGLVRTDGDGRFVFRAAAGPSRKLRFRYDGTPSIRGRTSTVHLHVRASSSVHASRHRVVNGEAVRFRGVVRSRPIPQTGKLLQLQVFSRDHWLTFATPRADARGKWTYEYRFTATRGVTRYRFRVRLPREAGSPYAAGLSRTVRVKVVGL